MVPLEPLEPVEPLEFLELLGVELDPNLRSTFMTSGFLVHKYARRDCSFAMTTLMDGVTKTITLDFEIKVTTTRCTYNQIMN